MLACLPCVRSTTRCHPRGAMPPLLVLVLVQARVLDPKPMPPLTMQRRHAQLLQTVSSPELCLSLLWV